MKMTEDLSSHHQIKHSYMSQVTIQVSI